MAVAFLSAQRSKDPNKQAGGGGGAGWGWQLLVAGGGARAARLAPARKEQRFTRSLAARPSQLYHGGSRQS